MKQFVFILSLLFALSNCSEKQKMSSLSVHDGQFIDDLGRTVILNGVNHVVKDPKAGYCHNEDESLFRHFQQSGFNCIRYGIIWDRLEPEPGKINEAYLAEIDKRVKWAEENNIWLILDMHQDLFSRKYSDGAPLWATLDEGMPHLTGDIWSDAYLISPAIWKAFDNFWLNKPASDGIGLQDHYANLWRTIAQRYAGSPSIAGFDIMNEPFMGSAAQEVFTRLLEGYAEVIAKQTGKILTEEELSEILASEERRTEALQMLDNQQLYATIIDRAYETVRQFEEGHLSRFYQKVRDAIREVDDRHIIFLEHNYFCNLGIRSSFICPSDANGNQDSLCAYAPHGYDLVTDTKAVASPGEKRVKLIFNRIDESGKNKGLPILIGEWGAFNKGDEYLPPTRHLLSLFEERLFGQTFWCWWRNIEKEKFYSQALIRPYPQLTNGRLLRYKHIYQENKFVCEWDEANKDYPTRFYIPDLQNLDTKNIRLEPESAIQLIPIEGSPAGYLEIEAVGTQRKIFVYLN